MFQTIVKNNFISCNSENIMIDFPSGHLIQICKDLHRNSFHHLKLLILIVSRNIYISISSSIMHSTGVSNEISASDVMSVFNRSYSSSSLSSKDNSSSEIEFVARPPNSWKRRRSTSLIEWKQAPPVKNTHADNETKNLTILPSDYINSTRTATDYLNHTPVTIYNDIKNSRFPTSASTSQLPTSASTPEFPRSTTISRSNSIRTNCSCFSCTQPGL